MIIDDYEDENSFISDTSSGSSGDEGSFLDDPPSKNQRHMKAFIGSAILKIGGHFG